MTTAPIEAPKRSASREHLLRELGTAVRLRRNELGLTLKGPVEKVHVSQRFLVQLESGYGNISVVRLEDVAEGLGTTGAALLASALRAPHPTSEPAVVALVGLRGAGKSAIGAMVATRLGVPFVELDELVVGEAQMTLATIFEIHSEHYYRSVERAVLRRLLARDEQMVIATGGSLVTDSETWGLLRSRARTVWLKATPNDHWERVISQGDVRPMRDRPRAMNELRALLTRRKALYEMASHAVDTSRRSPEAVADRVITLLGA